MIYAISDIHGCLDAFEKRLAQINAELEKKVTRLVLLGDYIDGGRDWLAEDNNYKTSGTFLTEEQRAEQDKIFSREGKIDYFVRTINANHRELLSWMNKLPCYYETATQIFVHAGVDEEIFCALHMMMSRESIMS